MTGVAAALLLGLTLFNVSAGGSLLYPPAIFTAAWTGYLLCLALLGRRFFPLSAETLVVFIAGAIALTVGGLVVTRFWKNGRRWGSTASRADRTIGRLLAAGLGICLLALPTRLLRLKELAGNARTDLLSPSFWVQVRRASVAEGDSNRASFLALTDNVILLAWFLLMAAAARDARDRRVRPTTLGIAFLAVIYSMMMASRAAVVVFVPALVAIVWMTLGRLPWKFAAISIVVAAIVFSLAVIFVQTRGVAGIWRSFELYALGGIVAFDHTVRFPGEIPPVWTITRSVLAAAGKLGAHVAVPPLHAAYAPVSDRELMNVYTMYFAYFPHYGWAGIAVIPVLLGAALTWLFLPALEDDPRWRFVYASAVAGLVLSEFGEYFLMNLTFLVKAALFALVLYGLPLGPRAGVPGEGR